MKIEGKENMQGAAMQPQMGPFGPHMGHYAPQMGPFGPQMGPFGGPHMGPFGPQMGPLGPQMGPFGPHIGFYPYGFDGQQGMMMPQAQVQTSRREPRKHVAFTEPEELSEPTRQDEEQAAIPRFVRLWFQLDNATKQNLRKMRDQCEAMRAENSDSEAEGIEMRSMMPWFAAKWFALSEEDKKHYRSCKKNIQVDAKRKAKEQACKRRSSKEASASETEASGDSSAEDSKHRQNKLPVFARIWFKQNQQVKQDLKGQRDTWVAAQKASGAKDPETDVEGMKTVLPRYAAKWFATSEEEKETYRAMRKEMNFGCDLPAFAEKWFQLPEPQKKQFRQYFKQSRVAAGQSESEEEHRIKLPPFAAKWFALPEEKRKAMRMMFRQARRCNGRNLPQMMSMMHVNEQGFPMTPSSSPMMYMQPTTQQSSLKRSHSFAGGCPAYPMQAWQGDSMGGPPFCMKKQWKRMSKAKESSDANTSDAYTSGEETVRPKDIKMVDKTERVPPFVKKWFALPMQARQALIMQNQHQKHGQDEGLSKLPQFATKWFALNEKQKQHWRQWNKAQKNEAKNMSTSVDSTKSEVPVSDQESADRCDIPEFAAKWFQLPEPQKKQFRQYSKQNRAATRHSEGEDDHQIQLPPFAAKWFALPEEKRKAMRMMFRQARRCNGRNLPQMMSMMHVNEQGFPMTPRPATCSSPMMYMQPTPQQSSLKRSHSFAGGCPTYPLQAWQGDSMGGPPFCMKKQWKRMSKAKESSDANTSDAYTSGEETARPADKKSVDKTERVPPFVKKWFALPMQARRALIMQNQHQKHGQDEGLSKLPQFATKWFALNEKQKQHWRQWNKAQNNDEKQIPISFDSTTKELAMSDQEDVQVPEFAKKWIALPKQRKHHLRLLQRYLNTKGQVSSDSSDEEMNETMPPFAAKWFALSKEERHRLKQSKRANGDKQPTQKPNKENFAGFHGYNWSPYMMQY